MAATVLSRGVNLPASSVDPQTFSVTLDAGVSRKFVVALARDSGSTIAGVTFDGNALTQRLSDANSGSANTSLEFWSYDIPDGMGTGSKTVSYDLSTATQNISAVWWILQDAATGAPEATDSDEGDTTATSLTLTATVTAGSVLLAAACNSSGTPNWSISAGDVTLRASNNEANLTSGYADGAQASAGSKSATWLASASGGFLVVGMASFAGIVGPTVTVQPSAQTARINGETAPTATFSCTATGTGTVDLTAEIESGVGSGSFGTLANGSGATWTGLTGTGTSSASVTLVGTFTAKTLSGRKVRLKADDDNGTSYSSEVVLTVLDGPVLSASTATTNGSGVASVTMTSDDALSANGEILLVTASINGEVIARTTVRPA